MNDIKRMAHILDGSSSKNNNANTDDYVNEETYNYQRNYQKIDSYQKFCKHCGNIIDVDCVVCPICGKQVEQLKTDSNITINNTVTVPAKHEPGISSKSRTITLVLAILLGECGVHHFYSGKIGMGILYFCTFGLFLIGWIVDIIMILTGKYTDKNGDYVLLW